MSVAASSPPTLIDIISSGNTTGGISSAGWRSVCRIERRAIWPTWRDERRAHTATASRSPVPSSS